VHERIIVKLLVHHDPHADAVAAHHRQQQLMALRQPLLAHRDLL
jgi:hypothetical protein